MSPELLALFLFVVVGALGEDRDDAVLLREVIDKFPGSAAADRERNDHAWKEDGIPDGKDRDEGGFRFGGGIPMAWLDRTVGSVDVEDQGGCRRHILGTRGIGFHQMGKREVMRKRKGDCRAGSAVRPRMPTAESAASSNQALPGRRNVPRRDHAGSWGMSGHWEFRSLWSDGR